MRSSTLFRIVVCAALVCSVVMVSPPGVAEATTSWRWLSPQPRGESLNAVDLVTTDIGYAVGNMGCLMKTYDGGANWIAKSSGTTEDLHAVAFIDADTGWVGGDNGFIAKTDGSSGATWTRQVTGITDGRIAGLFFRDANKGWAVDVNGRVLRTTNGGTTWASSSVPGVPDFSAVYFVSDFVGFATTRWSNKLYKSEDGGIIWTEVHDFGAHITDIAFKPGSTQIGWITLWQQGSLGSAFRTDDGGLTWDQYNIAGDDNAYLQSLAWAPDGSAVWMIGDNSGPRQIYTFADSPTPVVTALPYSPNWQDFPLYDVDCASATNVLAVGMFGTAVHSTDGSTFQDRTRVLPRQEINAVQFLDLRTGYVAASDGIIYKSTDAGKTWTTTPTGVTDPLHAAQFLDRNTGWAVGMNGTIIKTINGGTSWVKQTSGTLEALNSVCFVDANNGWAAGDNGTMLATTNGGTTWTPQTDSDFTTAAIHDVDFYNASQGAAVGYDRVIYTTDDGGANWMPRTGYTGFTFYDVEYVAPGTFFVAGDHTTLPTIAFSLLKFTGGGVGSVPAPADQFPGSEWASHGTIYDMVFLDANNGWVMFGDGTLARTTNGGTDWSFERICDEELRELGVVNTSAVWAGGQVGRLLSNYSFTPKTVYRFFNTTNGTHFYTASASEKEQVKATLSHVFQYEGVAYTYDDYYAVQNLHRFYRPSTGSHFYTADETEKANVIANLSGTFQYEGPAYQVSKSPGTATTVWRFYMPKTGAHFYTASEAEKNNVIATLSGTFQYEGPAFYLPQ